MANSYISLATFKAVASASATLKRAKAMAKDGTRGLAPTWTGNKVLSEVRENLAAYKVVKRSPKVIRQRAAEDISWRKKVQAGRDALRHKA